MEKESREPNFDVRSSEIIDHFELRCWARAYLVDHKKMPLHEGVDGLQDAAVSVGLIDLMGQDAVQAIMAAAFAPQQAVS